MNDTSYKTIMVRVVNETHGLKKRNEILQVLENGLKLYHVGFRKFNDGTDGLFLLFDSYPSSNGSEIK